MVHIDNFHSFVYTLTTLRSQGKHIIIMPNLKSAKKALRQAEKKALRNKVVKNAYKTAVKTARKGIIAGKDVKEELRLAQKKLDKAAKKGIIKKNTASRKLSRLVAQARKAGK